MIQYHDLMEKLKPVVRNAGAAIMDVYNGDIQMQEKDDGSPVTLADKRAEAIILEGLSKIAPEIAVVSEENAQSHSIKPPTRYFLVDPLDGTKEFLKADGEGNFTVNIGLIENGSPTLGIIFVPTSKTTYCGFIDPTTEERLATENGEPVSIRTVPSSGPVAMGSRSHEVGETQTWLDEHGVREIIPIGSSLKFCLLARGDADVYPRFAPTMEWDTAAGHAILSAAGGQVTLPDGSPFEYGKPGFKNGSFIARAGF